ncbi:MAG: hypothetical protein ACI8TX_003015 [Hyphomicrobiaceae bacterium]|jgi:hypothetical protein
MPHTAIFGPVLATLLLTLIVWVVMFVRRIPFIQSQNFTPEQMATPGMLAAASPPHILNPSDNFKNLLEVPILFYVLALYLFATNQVDAVYVGASWVFVLFRVLHSVMHCTANVVIVRFGFYAVSTLMVWFILVRAIFQYMGQ